MTAPNIAVAVDAVQELVRGYDDVRALVLALVEHMPPEGVAELLARLIECHPEAGTAGLRLLTSGKSSARLTNFLGDKLGAVGKRDGAWRVSRRRWNTMVLDPELHSTQEAAEAALIAAQPVPAAVVQVRS